MTLYGVLASVNNIDTWEKGSKIYQKMSRIVRMALYLIMVRNVRIPRKTRNAALETPLTESSIFNFQFLWSKDWHSKFKLDLIWNALNLGPEVNPIKLNLPQKGTKIIVPMVDYSFYIS